MFSLVDHNDGTLGKTDLPSQPSKACLSVRLSVSLSVCQLGGWSSWLGVVQYVNGTKPEDGRG